MSNFSWLQHFNLNPDPNWQVKTFTQIFLNIMSNFIPNEIKTIIPRDSPWLTKPLKTMLKWKKILLKNYKKHRYKEEDKVRLEVFRIECQQAVESAKQCYFTNLGMILALHKKSNWKIINGVMNRCRAPKIPPLLVDNVFVLNCVEKAKLFFFKTVHAYQK